MGEAVYDFVIFASGAAANPVTPRAGMWMHGLCVFPVPRRKDFGADVA
jgi:hypothetical protein